MCNSWTDTAVNSFVHDLSVGFVTRLLSLFFCEVLFKKWGFDTQSQVQDPTFRRKFGHTSWFLTFVFVFNYLIVKNRLNLTLMCQFRTNDELASIVNKAANRWKSQKFMDCCREQFLNGLPLFTVLFTNYGIPHWLICSYLLCNREIMIIFM